jgi:hypothetical protein
MPIWNMDAPAEMATGMDMGVKGVSPPVPSVNPFEPIMLELLTVWV